jgi:hypothetical protein
MVYDRVQSSRFKPDGLKSELVQLPHKPSAQLSFSFVPREGHSSHENGLLVLLSPIDIPKTMWTACLSHLMRIRADKGWPAMLCYDRFGCGQRTLARK